jgi:hypothetical protein
MKTERDLIDQLPVFFCWVIVLVGIIIGWICIGLVIWLFVMALRGV